MEKFTVSGLTLEGMAEHVEPLSEIFKQYGVLHLPKLLLGDEHFEWLMREIRALLLHLLDRAGEPGSDDQNFESLLGSLRACEPSYPAYFYELLSCPMKLTSGNMLKHHPSLVSLAQHIFGRDALIASPFQSDNFLIVPPGTEPDRFMLPIRQDFPDQMQSAQQLTYWLNMSDYTPGVGGVKVWPGSHGLGLCQCHKNVNGQYGVQIDQKAMARFPAYEIALDYGDVLVLHGLTLHQALPNYTLNRSRLVQHFRYANVNTLESTRYFWQSAVQMRNGVSFRDIYPAYDLTPAKETAVSAAC